MPSLDVVAPEFQGKMEYTKGDKEAIANINAMFAAPEAEYKILILDPSKCNIRFAPVFFEDPRLPLDGVMESRTFADGSEALSESKRMLDNAKDKYINQGNIQFKMTAVILSKSPSGKPMVQGFMDVEVSKSSTKYYVANNPHPRELRELQDEKEM